MGTGGTERRLPSRSRMTPLDTERTTALPCLSLFSWFPRSGAPYNARAGTLLETRFSFEGFHKDARNSGKGDAECADCYVQRPFPTRPPPSSFASSPASSFSLGPLLYCASKCYQTSLILMHLVIFCHAYVRRDGQHKHASP